MRSVGGGCGRASMALIWGFLGDGFVASDRTFAFACQDAMVIGRRRRRVTGTFRGV